MKSLHSHIQEKLLINKDFKQYGCSPQNLSELYEAVKIAVDEQGVGTRLKPVNLNHIDTSQCTAMSHIFSAINEELVNDSKPELKYIDISKWDVSNVSSFNCMFYQCTQLRSVGDLSNWKFKAEIIDMTSMFHHCHNLIRMGDISGWDVSHVKKFEKMFCSCNKLKDIGDLNSWNVDPYANLHMIFFCSAIEASKFKWVHK